MASSSSSSSSPSKSQSEPAIIEQVITEFFAKSLHIILESRSPSVSSRNYNSAELAGGGGGSPASSSNSSSPSGARPRDKWFNLALRECPAALENFDLWRQSSLDPLVIDIILTSSTTTASSPEHPRRLPGGAALLRTLSNKERHYDAPPDSKSEKIVERWIIQYESQDKRNYPVTRGSGIGLHSFEVPALYKKIYKRIVVLLRSLYVIVRLLPAYGLFRDLNASAQLRAFNLSHRISYFVEPFTRSFEADMNKFNFSSVDTPCGRLSLAVSYLTSIGDVNTEPSTPLTTQFIPDYVGSPTTDPLRKFQSLPTNYISFGRRHSWSNDHGISTTRSPMPSPTYSDSHASRFTRIPSLPPYYPSPPFSPSSSPSPLANLAAGHLNSELLRTESAPVGIPIPRPGRSIGLHNAGLPPSPSPKGDKQQVKKDFHSGMALQKVIPVRKEDVGSVAGLNSPRITFSRSLSRLSFLDEFDDPEFACPFADDDDASDIIRRVEPIDGKGHTKKLDAGRYIAVRKSQEAEVGALVKMLKTAAPLRQDPSVSVRLSQAPKEGFRNMRIEPSKAVEIGESNLHCAASDVDMSTSGLIKLRTAAYALEELRSYCKMKEQLLKQGESHSLNEHQEPGFAEKGSSGF